MKSKSILANSKTGATYLARLIFFCAMLTVASLSAWASGPVLTLPVSVTVPEDGSTNQAIGVTDAGVAIFTVTTTATSSDTNLVSDASLIFTGFGTNRLLTIKPGLHQSGTAVITVVASDATTSTTNTFPLTVTFTNYPPVFLSSITNQTNNENSAPLSLPFSVSDIQTPGSNLVVTATSSNPTLVPNRNLVITGSGTNSLLTLTLAPNQNGLADIQLVVTDSGSDSATNDFVVDVWAVNQPPTFTLSTNRISYNEYFGPVTIPNFVTGVTPGPNQSSESIQFNLLYTTNEFTTPPTLSTNGTLAFQVVSNWAGTNVVTIILTNSGSLTNGGVNKLTNTFTLAVAGVIEPPSFTLATNLVVMTEDTQALTNRSFVTSRANNGVGSETNYPYSYTLTTVTTNSTNAAFTTLTLATNGILTVLPKAHSYGTNTVTVVMNVTGKDTNGWINSATNTFEIAVVQTNHAPMIVGATNRSVLENATNGLTAVINVWDYDQTTNFTFTATSSNISVATVSVATNSAGTSNVLYTLTFALATNASGVVPIHLVASEGNLTSTTNFNLTVTLVNHAPTFTLATNLLVLTEETALVTDPGFVSSWSQGPSNQSTETHTFTATTVTTNSTNASFTTLAVATNGTLTILPKSHSFGTNTVTLVMTDSGGTANGGVNSFTNTFQVEVMQTNHAPVIVGATNRTVLENATNGLTASINVWDYDKHSTNLTLTATSLSNSLVTVHVTGTNVASPTNAVFTLGFGLTTNDSGTATIQLIASEGALSTTNTFTLTVTLVNHAPSFTLGTNLVVVEEETALVTDPGFVSSWSQGPSNQSGETHAFTLTTPTNNATNAVFSTLAVATNGTLTILPKAHSYGTNTVTIVMTDSGGNANGGVNSVTNTFSVEVMQTNHAPVIVGATNRTVLENATTGLTASINVWDYDKQSTNLTLTATSVSNSLVTVSVTGTNVASATNAVFTLAFGLTTNDSGTATIQLIAGEGPLSATNTFTLTVTLVNHAPSFTLATNVVVLPEETALVTDAGFVSSYSQGPSNQSAETHTFALTTATNNATNAVFTTLAVATNGTLTILPKSHSYGTNLVTIVMTDSGGNANGGINTVTNTFSVQVMQTNHAPVIVGATNRTILENARTGLTASINVWDYDKQSSNLTLTASSGSNNLAAVSVTGTNVASGTNAVFTLTFALGSNANGSVPIQLIAAEGPLSTTNSFNLAITAVSNAPSFTLATNFVRVPEETASVTQPGFVVGWKSSKVWTFSATAASGSSSNVTFAAAPAVDTNGTLTFSPAAHSFGTNGVTLVMSNGTNSFTNNFQIGVAQIQHAPMIVSTNVTALENTTNVLTSTVTVWDYDTQSTNLTLAATSMSNSLASVSVTATNVTGASNVVFTLTFTLVSNANGTVPLQLVASEGALSTTNTSISLVITPVNQAPSFAFATNYMTNDLALVAEESSAVTNTGFLTNLSAGPANESSQTWTFSLTTATNNATNAQFAVMPAVDTNGNLTFTLAQHSFGTNDITVVMTDSGGTANGGVNTYSNTFQLGVEQIAHAPEIDGVTNITVLENGANATLAINVWDYDQTTSFVLTAVSSDTTLATVSFVTNSTGTSNVTYTLTLAQVTNAYGNPTITLVASEGSLSTTNSFTLTIWPVNLPPTNSLTSVAMTNDTLVVPENAGLTTISNFVTGASAGPANQSGQTWTFVVSSATTNSTNASFAQGPTIDTNGTLVFAAATNSFGTNTMMVVMTTTGGTTNGGDNAFTNSFELQVTQVQYPPAFSGITSVTMLENVTSNFVFGLYDPLTTNFTVTCVSSNTNLVNVSTGGAGNSPSVLLVPVTYQTGTTTVSITADDGTLTNSTNFTVTILPVNQPPSFNVAVPSVTVDKYDVAVVVSNAVTNISAGPTNESGQSVTFTVSNSSPSSFLVPPSIDTNGILSFTPGMTAGTVTVSIVAVDDGGTANGGVNTSAAQTLAIVIPPNAFQYLTGTFAGLFYDADSPTNASSGYFNLALASNGTFNGYVLCAGDSNTFNGQFSVSNSSATVTASNYALSFTVDTTVNWTESISGSVSNIVGLWNVPLMSYLAGYSSTFPTPLAGEYNMALPGLADPAVGPAGDSIFNLVISNTGVVSLGGYMADDTYAGQVSQLSLYGYCPVYLPLYSNGLGGSVFGWLNFTGALSNSVDPNSTLTWIAQPGNTALYTGGFTNQSLPLVSLYNPALSALLSFSSGSVILSGGDLATPITNAVTISGNVITVNVPGTNALSLTISPSMGEVAGSFVDPSTNSCFIYGVILQNTTNVVRGYFLGTNQVGSFILLSN